MDLDPGPAGPGNRGAKQPARGGVFGPPGLRAGRPGVREGREPPARSVASIFVSTYGIIPRNLDRARAPGPRLQPGARALGLSARRPRPRPRASGGPYQALAPSLGLGPGARARALGLSARRPGLGPRAGPYRARTPPILLPLRTEPILHPPILLPLRTEPILYTSHPSSTTDGAHPI